MPASKAIAPPLVSVVIPCYNHACYLSHAVESVRQQNYPNLEVVVVDDGSTDDTREVANRLHGVTYVHQQNQGLSAARNTGIKHSSGAFLVFLDADDWLLPDAISTNLHYLLQNKTLAFVSGGHEKVDVCSGLTHESISTVDNDHYLNLLRGNYIGMHAAVMYRREIFDELQYDTSLKRCEDYDLYLRISRRHAVFHHTNKIAAYRLHSANMSGAVPAMLASVLDVLNRQQPHLQTKAEQQAFAQGQRTWRNYYCKELYMKIRSGRAAFSRRNLSAILFHCPSLIFKLLFMQSTSTIKKIVKSYSPDLGLNMLHKIGLYRNYTPAVGHVALGHLERTSPLSKEFGYDRGGPIDRYYIENFLRESAESIKGRVLEIGDNAYTLAYGGQRVTQSEILHVDASNPHATWVGDISNAPHIPDNTFDCLILTQTLHLIYDFKGALQTCHRILKPGGKLLLTVPGITPIDQGEWKETWYWSFTDKAMRRLMAEFFPEDGTTIKAHGNVFAASAFLYGMGLPEVPTAKLDKADPHYQVVVTVCAQK